MIKKTIAPAVFISYSWSSQEHEEWVKSLATRLRKDGVDAFIDKWRLKPGHDRFAFMEKMISSKDIHKVLVVCDKQYKEKADQRMGGVGVETQVLSKNIYTKVDQEKFIPIIAERDENGNEFLPTYMESLIYIDLSDSNYFESGYKNLLYAIFETVEHEEPALGDIPDYILEKKPGVKDHHISNVNDLTNVKVTKYFEFLYVTNDNSHKHSIKNVCIDAFLPNEYDSGSCLVSFVNEEISGCMFTLYGKNLVKTFFNGLKTKARDCKRSFLIGYEANTNKYLVQFPSNRFFLNANDVEELCEIIDNFFPYYVKAIRKYHLAKSSVITSVKELHNLAQDIQIFYTVHDSVTPSVEVKKAYEALKVALFRAKLSDSVFSYISSKLPIRELTRENVCLKIMERQDDLDEEFCHNGEIDMILRSLVVLLRDCKSQLSLDEIKEIAKLLQTFEDMKDIFDFDGE